MSGSGRQDRPFIFILFVLDHHANDGFFRRASGSPIASLHGVGVAQIGAR
jgi:hypothetical protein